MPLSENDLLERLIEEAGRHGFVKHQRDDALAELQKTADAVVDCNTRMTAIEEQQMLVMRESADKDTLLKKVHLELSQVTNDRGDELTALKELLDATDPFFRPRRKPTRAQRRALMLARAAVQKLFDAVDPVITV